jgi:hypothetical protein
VALITTIENLAAQFPPDCHLESRRPHPDDGAFVLLMIADRAKGDRDLPAFRCTKGTATAIPPEAPLGENENRNRAAGDRGAFGTPARTLAAEHGSDKHHDDLSGFQRVAARRS